MIGMEEIKERRGKIGGEGKKKRRGRRRRVVPLLPQWRGICFVFPTNGRSRGCAGEELLVRLRKRPALIGGWAVDPAALTR